MRREKLKLNLKSGMKMKRNKKCQVWVETVVYLLIGLSIIALILAMSVPKINEWKDKSIIEQSFGALNEINSKVLEVRNEGTGNIRNLGLKIKKGVFVIDSENDTLSYMLEDSKHVFSELGEETSIGDIKVLTEKVRGKTVVNLWIKYENLDLTSGSKEKEILQAASMTYQLKIENKGKLGEKINVDIESLN